MNYQNFLDSPEIKADFNIGGKRVNGAILDFSGISPEQLALAGIGKILIDLQNKEKLHFMENGQKIANYDALIAERAQELSGSEIDMTAYCAKRNWNFEKGEEADKVGKAKGLADKMTAEEKAELLKHLQG